MLELNPSADVACPDRYLYYLRDKWKEGILLPSPLAFITGQAKSHRDRPVTLEPVTLEPVTLTFHHQVPQMPLNLCL